MRGVRGGCRMMPAESQRVHTGREETAPQKTKSDPMQGDTFWSQPQVKPQARVRLRTPAEPHATDRSVLRIYRSGPRHSDIFPTHPEQPESPYTSNHRTRPPAILPRVGCPGRQAGRVTNAWRRRPDQRNQSALWGRHALAGPSFSCSLMSRSWPKSSTSTKPTRRTTTAHARAV